MKVGICSFCKIPIEEGEPFLDRKGSLFCMDCMEQLSNTKEEESDMTKNNQSNNTFGAAKPNPLLTQLLAGQLVGKHFGPQDPEAYDKPTNIVVAKNGVFRVVKTPVALFITQIAEVKKDQQIPGLPEMKEGVQLLIPKIPFKYWLQTLSFYRDVYNKDKTEASVLFFWNHDNVELPTHYTDNTPVKGLTQDGQLIIYCPRQKNSSGLSDFTGDGMVNWLREHTTPLLETHSH